MPLSRMFFWRTRVLFVGPLIPLFWTSDDLSPWVSKPGWIPHLRALLRACHEFLRFTSDVTPFYRGQHGSWSRSLHATYVAEVGCRDLIGRPPA